MTASLGARSATWRTDLFSVLFIYKKDNNDGKPLTNWLDTHNNQEESSYHKN